MKKLVFLHIEKSAGSAQRALLYESLGKSNVFWYGINSHSSTFIPEEVDSSFFIGGHRKYGFYQADEYGYLAVVREPLDRVVSLFNYLKTQELENWISRGLDPDSLKNTVSNSQAFREMITDAQCEYISGSKSFEKTVEHINQNKYVVATLESIDKVNSLLVDSVELISGSLRPDNVGRVGYKADIEIDDETKSELLSLLDQDIKLYQYLISKRGLISTITKDDWSFFNRLVKGGAKQPTMLVNIRNMKVFDNRLSLLVDVLNLSNECLNHEGQFVGVRVFDRNGECFREGRAKLVEVSEPRTRHFFKIELADFNRRMAKTFQLGIVNTIEKRWLTKDEVDASLLDFDFMND